MFESALITRVGSGNQVDLGLLAETTFLYGSTHLVLNSSSILALVDLLRGDDLLAFLDRASVKLSYVHPNFGVISEGQIRTHQFAAFSFYRTSEKKKISSRDALAISLHRKLGSSPSTHRLVKTLNDRIELHKFKASPKKQEIIPILARQDVNDAQFMRMAVLAILRHLVPSFVAPPDYRFEVFDTGHGYVVDTNLNFETLNSIYHRIIPPSHSSLSPEYLLAHVITARADTYFAAEYMAELVVDPAHSEIIQIKHFDFLRRRLSAEREVSLFHEIIVPELSSIREVMNSGERSVYDFLKLLDQAAKFRSWLQDRNPDAGLIQTYYRAATERTWADKLPSKTVRFIVAAGLGLAADALAPTGIGTVMGLGIGATDSLYLDKVIKGWRPNHFIEGPYREFVLPKEAAPEE